MRLRIQTLPPLPALKVWFVPRPTSAALSLSTIVELKRALCHDIEQLQLQGIQHYDIRLLLDGFELLGDLPYHEVLRDGDLVCVQVFKEPRSDIEVSRKRKAVEDVEGALVLIQPWSCSNVLLDLESARKRRKKSVGKKGLKITPQRTSSSSSSGSSESSSASSESSESDYRSSESSKSSESSSSRRSSSSSSSVSSLPTPQPSKPQKIKTSARATTM
jgi:hypothetical protein